MLKSFVAGIGIILAGLFGTHQVQPAAPVPTYPPAAHVAIQEAPGTPHPTVPAATPPTSQPTTIINQPVVERIIERTMPSASSGITSSELDAQIQDLTGKFSTQLARIAAVNAAAPNNFVTVPVFAQAGRIDNLANVSISNATVHGVSGLTASDIPSLSYLPLSGGNLTYASSTLFSVFNNAYFGATATSSFNSAGALTLATPLGVGSGGTGWNSISAGSLLFGNGSAALATSSNLYWDNINSRLGIGTANPQAALDLSNSSLSHQSVLDLKGTDESVYGEYPAQMWEIANGSVTTPVITAGSTFKISRYDNVASTTCNSYGSPNKNDSGCDSALEVSSFSGSTGDMITNGILVGAQNSRTALGSDAIALSASGRVTGSGTGVGTGAYLEGFRNTTTAMAEGAELTAWNYTNSDCTAFNINGFSQCTGGWFASRGNGSTFVKDSVALGVGSGDGKSNWLTGLGFTTNSVASTTIDDESSADTSIKINGNHTYALIAGPTAGSVGIGTLTPSYALDVAGFINTNANSGFKQAGNTVLFASSTNRLTAAGISALANYFNTTSTGGETAIGYQALGNATSSTLDVAIGYQALKGSATVSSAGGNTAVGYQALTLNSSGIDNVSVGQGALAANTSGSFSTAVGQDALLFSTGFGANSAFGQAALLANTTGIHNVGLGLSALRQNQTGNFNTAVGGNAGLGVANNSFSSDSLFGFGSGYALTTGSNNIFLGYEAASTTATGSNNIVLGYNLDLPSTNGSNQLNIGNIIYGTGLTGTLTTTAGSIGIATTTPWGRLSVTGAGTGTGYTFVAADSNNTPLFNIQDNGNVGIGTTSPTTALQVNGTITPNTDNVSTVGNATYRWNAVYATNNVIQTSDVRLKENVTNLSYGLADILKLRPVSFTWIAQPQQGTKLGFIAQEVQPILPETVNVGDDANHTLGLTYTEFIPIIVKAIQQLAAQVGTNVSSTANAVFDTITAHNAALDYVRADNIEVGSPTKQGGITLYDKNGKPGCVTLSDAASGTLTVTNGGCGSDTASPSGDTSPSSPDITPPVITINGDNPATIHVGDSYADLSATVTDNVDQNLGLKYFLNGALVSNIVISTSAVATDTIDYVATDTAGNTATSTRTVIVEAATSTTQ